MYPLHAWQFAAVRIVGRLLCITQSHSYINELSQRGSGVKMDHVQIPEVTQSNLVEERLRK